MDLIGQAFGRLTVIDNAPSSPNRHKQVLCECECGNQKVVRVEALLNGKNQKLRLSYQNCNETRYKCLYNSW